MWFGLNTLGVIPPWLEKVSWHWPWAQRCCWGRGARCWKPWSGSPWRWTWSPPRWWSTETRTAAPESTEASCRHSCNNKTMVLFWGKEQLEVANAELIVWIYEQQLRKDSRRTQLSNGHECASLNTWSCHVGSEVTMVERSSGGHGPGGSGVRGQGSWPEDNDHDTNKTPFGRPAWDYSFQNVMSHKCWRCLYIPRNTFQSLLGTVFFWNLYMWFSQKVLGSAPGCLLPWRPLLGFRMSTHPTVVMVTKAHQMPSRTPVNTLPGKSCGFT